MERTVFHILVVFLLTPVPSSLQETETHENRQDPCGELKQLRDLVYQQAATLSEIKTKMVYVEKEHAGETKNITFSNTVAVYTISALYHQPEPESVCRN